MAAFQLTLYGRFWVTPKEESDGSRKIILQKNWYQLPEKAQNELVASIRKLHELHRYFFDIYKLTSCCLVRKAREIVRIVYRLGMDIQT